MCKLKDEAIFMSIAGYIGHIQSTLDSRPDSEFTNLLKSLCKHFKKEKRRYTQLQAMNISKFIRNKIEPSVKAMKINSAELFIIAALEYLIKEADHMESRLYFSHFNITLIRETLERNKKYTAVLHSHMKHISDILN